MLTVTRIPSLPARIETRTDAYRVLNNEAALERYVAEYGDVLVAYDKRFKVYRVPQLSDEIKAYETAKLAYCDKYGCE